MNKSPLAALGLTALCNSDKLLPAIFSDSHCQYGQSSFCSTSPIDGQPLASVSACPAEQLLKHITAVSPTFLRWRETPAPQRGELVSALGQQFVKHKATLATLICQECGKNYQEALGEVQEAIDICQFAQGLSRQLYGLTIASERPRHRMMEQWHPLGLIGVITAFNFPVAVWTWNAAIALVCGNQLIWKPSEKTPLCALACQQLFNQARAGFSKFPQALSSVVLGDRQIGQVLAQHKAIALISATGSVAMGRAIAQTVAARLGKQLLELGGNNAMIVTPSANLALAIPATVFSAVGTCGQRCTSLRRLIVHDSIADQVSQQLVKAYQQLTIGDPRDENNLVGPLIDQQAWQQMQVALQQAIAEGGKVLFGGERILQGVPTQGYYVRPAIIEIDPAAAVLQQETFAPLLYLLRYQHFDQAIAIHNRVPQGLSSAIFTGQHQEAELFLSASGSDCGIANVNIGTSGAEIGGAFGGEKDTGGGRESGSDAWKNYMRRSTNTINFGNALPLAQGIKFDT
jgi:aldehyde dehydrogenase (NAD+)